MDAGKIGKSVWYLPSAQDYPQAPGVPLAAIITGWNEDSEQASLVIFPPGAAYVMEKQNVVEGTLEGNFQQPSSGGTQSAQSASTQSVHKK